MSLQQKHLDFAQLRLDYQVVYKENREMADQIQILIQQNATLAAQINQLSSYSIVFDSQIRSTLLMLIQLPVRV